MPIVDLKGMIKRHKALHAAGIELAKATRNGKPTNTLAARTRIAEAEQALDDAAFEFVKVALTGSDGREFRDDAKYWLRHIRANACAVAKAFGVAKKNPFGVVFERYEGADKLIRRAKRSKR